MSELLSATAITDDELQRIEALGQKVAAGESDRLEDATFLLFSALVRLADIQADNMIRVGHTVLTQDLLAVYGQALSIEVSEFLNELPWKPWKTANFKTVLENRDVREDIAFEFADILAFLGAWISILNTLGISPFELAEAYAEKTRINHARFAGEVEGYGV